MSKFFNEDGTPSWLPVDFDVKDVFNAEFHDKVDLNQVRFSSIFILLENGSEIEKHFKHKNFPDAIESWSYLKRLASEAWKETA